MSELISHRLGLHFPVERFSDLRRGVAAASGEFGFADPDDCAEWLLTAPLSRDQLHALAAHLTIGETYFFRDRRTFDALAQSVLPALARARRGGTQRIRLWSAACATGEEAYSLAILLRTVLPDIRDWHVTILASDVNAVFLRKAAAGVYGEWSFRDAPPGFRERYFERTADGRYAIRPEIRSLVTFEHVNLVSDSYPSLATDSNAMDVIFCRNVLMYFTPVQMRRVIGRLRCALIDGGWLAVAPSEASQDLFRGFVARNFPGAILYQKTAPAPQAVRSAPPGVDDVARLAASRSPASAVPPSSASAAPPRRVEAPPSITVATQAASLYEQGRYGEAADALLGLGLERPLDPRASSLLVRALANQGRLAEALAWCDRWIGRDKVNAAAHYIRAAIVLEHGPPADARRSLQRAIYLDPSFALAHFTLGNLALREGDREGAARHFRNTRRLLERVAADAPLPEGDGLTAGRLAETVASLIGQGAA